MRRTQLSSVVVAVLMSVLPRPAGAQLLLSDTQWIKPMMMLLVDTSGSMERRIDEEGQPRDRLPECASTEAVKRKNRWAVTLETLTGSFGTNPQCSAKPRSGAAFKGAYDEDYFLPYHDYSASYATQGQGLLDAYKNRAKFALMTFDGMLTTLKGDTLVSFDSYASNANLRAAVTGQPGMYSYPPTTAAISMTKDTPVDQFGWKPFAFPGCPVMYGVNVGARDEDPTHTPVAKQGDGTISGMPGALISTGRSDSSSDIEAVNANIQNSLLYTRPYGGTPIAGMLDDFRHYLRSHPDVKKGADLDTSDPYYSCRERYAVLLTDGAPDALFRGDKRFPCENSGAPTCPKINGVPRCQCPYGKEADLAGALRDDGLDKLWVVAFNVDNNALLMLNQIAQAGGDQDALVANTPEELQAALSDVMATAGPPATSRSVPVVINTGRPLTLKGAQYEITAGFQVPESDDAPWRGLLFRRRVECSGASVASQELSDAKGDMFHLTLNRRTTDDRVIRTLRASPSAPALAPNKGSLITGNDQSSMLLGISTTNLVKPTDPETFGSSLSGLVVGVIDSPDASQSKTEHQVAVGNFDKTLSPHYFDGLDATRDTISNYVRGLSAKRVDAKLADIVHSNPAALPPLAAGSSLLNTFDPDLRGYYADLIATTGAAPRGHYGTGGRPGVIFVGTNDGVLHAFNLDTWTNKDGKTYAGGHEFWGFVPPALFHNMKRITNPKDRALMFDGTPVVKDVIFSRTSNSLKPGTVLLAAVRGAPAYVALDVTFPEETPKVLWQRSFGYLGETVATPAIAHVRITWNNVAQVRAVAILPGGRSLPKAGSCAVNQADSRAPYNGGRAQVRCWNLLGRSLYVVDMETGVLIQEFDARHFPSPMSGSVAVDSENLALTKAAYLTDEDGVLWRLSMLSTNPSEWRVAPIYDIFAGNATGWDGVSRGVVGTPALAGRVSSYPPVLVRDRQTGNLTIVVGTGDIDDVLNERPNRVVSLKEVRAMAGKELGLGTVTANWSLQLDASESVTGPITVLDDIAYFTTFTGPSDNSKCLVGGSRIVGAHVRKPAGATSLPLGGLTPETGDPKVKVLWYEPISAPKAMLLGLNVSPDPICVQGTTVNDPNAPGSPLRIDDITARSHGSYQLRTMVAGQGGNVGGAAGSMAPKQLTRSVATPNVARSVGWASSIE